MVKLMLLPLLLGASCLIAGLYGAAHNQISYTVSPEYFHAFKFEQFGIPGAFHDRAGAAIVGWQATWWMGLVVGAPVLLVGLILPGARRYAGHVLAAFALVAVTAFILGLGALGYGVLSITPENVPVWVRDGVVDRVAFARAGTMHNFSYVGGALGILTGAVYLVIARLRIAGARRCGTPTAH